MPESTLGGKATESNIAEKERSAMEYANKTISVLEEALAVWDSSKEKPGEFADDMKKLRSFHKALTGWLAKMIKSPAIGFDARVDRLWEFVDICREYGEL